MVHSLIVARCFFDVNVVSWGRTMDHPYRRCGRLGSCPATRKMKDSFVSYHHQTADEDKPIPNHHHAWISSSHRLGYHQWPAIKQECQAIDAFLVLIFVGRKSSQQETETQLIIMYKRKQPREKRRNEIRCISSKKVRCAVSFYLTVFMLFPNGNHTSREHVPRRGQLIFVEYVDFCTLLYVSVCGTNETTRTNE